MPINLYLPVDLAVQLRQTAQNEIFQTWPQ
jgi:hypothetical protein